MKRIMAIVVLMCAVAFQVNAQNSVEKLLKEIEQKVKQADKHPKDGKMQLNAAYAIFNDTLSGKRDMDRALDYANRALKIAQEHPAPQDTLLSLTCEALAIIYMGKQDMEKSTDFFERALDAYEVELGRFDPVTNGNKMVYGWMMSVIQPSRGLPKILEAVNDNARAPQDKRIKNMDDAKISLEMALELLIAEQTNQFRHALPTITVDGKRYFLVQTGFWNMEQPLIGWIAQTMISSDTKNDDAKDYDTILYGEDGQFRVLSEADEDQRKILFNIQYSKDKRDLLELNDGEARIKIFDEGAYNQVLGKFREFKAANKQE